MRNDDMGILNRTKRYISKLREIWVSEVMSQKQTLGTIPVENYPASRISSISV